MERFHRKEASKLDLKGVSKRPPAVSRIQFFTCKYALSKISKLQILNENC